MADVPLSTIIKDYATAAAIVVGGGWALWRWVFEERLRRHRDFPALDGELNTAESSLGTGKVILTINALWRNRGTLPVDVDPARTVIKVYKIDPLLQAGPFDPSAKEPCYFIRPLSDLTGFILEPGTDSVIQHCIVLPADQVFVIHWAICIAARQKAYPHLKSEMWCLRSLVWHPAR